MGKRATTVNNVEKLEQHEKLCQCSSRSSHYSRRNAASYARVVPKFVIIKYINTENLVFSPFRSEIYFCVFIFHTSHYYFRYITATLRPERELWIQPTCHSIFGFPRLTLSLNLKLVTKFKVENFRHDFVIETTSSSKQT